MNLVLIEPTDRVGDDPEVYVLGGVRAAHVREVLRAAPGKQIRVGLLEGPHGTGEVLEVSEQRVCLRCVFESETPQRPIFDLILAVPRPKSLRKLLPEVTAFGVDRIVLLRTWRVAKPFLSATVLHPDEYRPLLHEGMMQGRHTREPEVLFEPLFKPFVEDRLDALFANAAHRIVAHPGVERSMAQLRVGPQDRVVGVIGPEGGLLPYEVAALEQHGFEPVRMGPTPLRVETACVALMAQVELLRGM
jgi:RsmE family RNA methyltransferase